jgi:hypothetical protein
MVQVLRSRRGLDKSLRFIIGMGTITRFGKQVYGGIGFRTRTILTIAIYSNSGDVIALGEMINRIDGSAFDDDNIIVMLALSVFCGISRNKTGLYYSAFNSVGSSEGSWKSHGE